MMRWKNQKGNVVAILLGGVALTGTLSYMFYQVLSGPLASMSRITKSTAAQTEMLALSKSVVVAAVNQAASGDCDADGSIEPTEWRVATGDAPGNAGWLPTSMAAKVTDPWGTDYGYCVWDVGTENTPSTATGTCPANARRLAGSPTPLSGVAVSQTAFAIISAGPDRDFTTNCNAYNGGAPTADLIVPGGDDVVMRYTYTEASIMAGDLWRLQAGAPDTAEIIKDLEVPAAAISALALTTAAGGAITATGGLQLADQNKVLSCGIAAGNDGLLRYNTGVGGTTPINVESATPLTTETDGTTTSSNASFPASALPTANGTVIVTIAGEGTGGAFSVSSVTDNQSNTYNQVATANAGANGTVYIYEASNVTTGSPFTVTVNYGGGTSRKLSWGAMAVTGLVTASVVDQTGTGNNTTATATSSGAAAGAGTGQANTLAVAVHGYEGVGNDDINVNYVPQYGWTGVFTNQNASASMGMSTVYKVMPVAGVTATHNWVHDAQDVAATANKMAAIATFNAASTAAGTAGIDFCDGVSGNWTDIGSGGGSGIDSLSDAVADDTNENIGLGQNALTAVTAGTVPTLAVEQVSTPVTQTANAASAATTFASAPTAGNTVIVVLAGKGTNGSFDNATVTDNQGNIYSTVVQGVYANADTSGPRGQIFVATNVATGTPFTITATPPQDSMINMAALELSGGDPVVPVEKIGWSTFGSGSSASSDAGPLADPGLAPYLYVALIFDDSNDSNVNFSPEVGWTSFLLDQDSSAGLATSAVYRVITTPGYLDHWWNHDSHSGDNMETVMATFPVGLAPGTGNIAVGEQALEDNTTGAGNTAMGYQAMLDNTTGTGNVGVGYRAVSSAGFKLGNVGVGKQALENSTNGHYNTAVGSGALLSNGTGRYNLAIGFEAARNLAGRTGNVAIGRYAGYTHSNDYNTAVGHGALGSAAGVGGTTAIGWASMGNLNTGDGNVGVGFRAAAGLFSSGGNSPHYNTAVGSSALFGNWSQGQGDGNTALGYETLEDNTTGDGNTAAGFRALLQNTTGSGNTVFGAQALDASVGQSNNTAVGYQALTALTSGTGNSLIGYNAGAALTTASYVVGIGSNAFLSGTNLAAVGSVGIGYNVLASYNATAGENVVIGSGAASSNTGSGITAIGAGALAANTNSAVTAVGYGAFNANGAGGGVAFGAGALLSNTSGTGNVAVGWDVLASNQTHTNSTAVGASAAVLATAHYTTAIGSLAGTSITTSAENTAFGYAALASRSSSAGQGTAFGFQAMAADQSGSGSLGFGFQALLSNVSGQRNTAFGYWALTSATGDNNTAVGYQALQANTSVANNTAAGYQALYANTTGGNNVAIGTGTLDATGSSSTVGDNNTAIGFDALGATTSGDNNTAVGHDALASNTTGGDNTGVGNGALSANGTGSQNTAIGNLANVASAALSNTTAIGYNASVSSSNTVQLGDGNITVIAGQVAWSPPSDRRLKTDICDSDLGLDFVRHLRPVSYRLKSDDRLLQYGFIAQEVEKALEGRVTNMVTQDNDDAKTYHIRSDDMIAPLVKAVQERQHMIESRQREIDALRAEVERMEALQKTK